MEKRTKKHYSEEFKQEAVELAGRIGITKASRELGAHETSIRKWKVQSTNPELSSETLGGKKSYKDLEKENLRLQKENGYLKIINKVLKKSTAIFSADHMENSK